MKKNLFFSLFLIVSVLLSIGFVSAGQADGRYIQNNISEVMTPAANQFIGGTFLVTANVSAKATNHESTSLARFNITDMYVYINNTDAAISRLVAIVNCKTVSPTGTSQCNATNWNYTLDTKIMANGNYTILVTFINQSYNGTTSGAWNSSGMYVNIDNAGPNMTINMTKSFTSTTNYCINTNRTLINITGTVTGASTFGYRGMYQGNVTLLGSRYWGTDRTKSWVNNTKAYPYFAFTNGSAFPPGTYTLTLYANSTVNNTQIFGTNASITFYVDTIAPTPDTYAIWISKTDESSSFCKPTAIGTEECTEEKYGYPFTIEPTEKITFHCGFTDEVSLMTYSYFVKKPGDSSFHNVLSDTSSATFDYLDNVKAGDYLVYCVATDVCGNASYISANYESQALKFRVRSAEDYGTPSEGGSSGSSGTSTKTFAVDFSKTAEKTLSKGEGRILTLTFDGTTEHTVTIDKIMADSVTVTIRSEPVTVTIKKGETVNVDVNKDGTEDLALTLTNIVNGQAMIKYTKLEAGAAKIIAEEKTAQEETVTTTTTKIEVEEPTTKTGLWITIAIIVLGLVAYFIYAAKKR